jgi:hypothetical protein
MAGDFSKPTVSELYTAVPTQITDLCKEIAQWLDGTSTLNPPVGAKRWNTNKFEKHSGGGTWTALAALYDINVQSLQGYVPGNGSGALALSNGTLCTNLNAQYLNGASAGNSNGQIALSNGVTCSNLSADMLDGLDASVFPRLNGSNNNFSGHILISGSLSLPSTVSPNQLAFAAGYSSPVAAKMLFGDGSGWKIQWGRRVGGGESIIAELTDLGAFYCASVNVTGSLAASSNVTAGGSMTANALIYGRGGGRGMGQLTLGTGVASGGANGDIHFQY